MKIGVVYKDHTHLSESKTYQRDKRKLATETRNRKDNSGNSRHSVGGAESSNFAISGDSKYGPFSSEITGKVVCFTFLGQHTEISLQVGTRPFHSHWLSSGGL